ncbi:hypothetical protein VTN96DRAFT_7612 [Rasamsonia emersonii]
MTDNSRISSKPADTIKLVLCWTLDLPGESAPGIIADAKRDGTIVAAGNPIGCIDSSFPEKGIAVATETRPAPGSIKTVFPFCYFDCARKISNTQQNVWLHFSRPQNRLIPDNR